MERLRGLNFGGWLSQIDAIEEKDPSRFPGVDEHMATFIGRDDFLKQKTWGFNHVRLPVDAVNFFSSDNDVPIEKRLEIIDHAVQWAKEAGLFLIIDLHECPGHDFASATDVPVQQLFLDPVYAKRTKTIWRNLAERFSSEKHVLFELLNEPVAPDAELWNRIKDELCSAVRSIAPENYIIVGSNMWNWPSTYKEFTPVDCEKVIYNFHFYEPLLFTHQHAPWMNEPEIRHDYTYPDDYAEGFSRKFGFVHSAGKWDRDRFFEEIEPVVSFGEKYGATIICNEFGVYTPVSVELQVGWLKDLLYVLKEYGIGFSYWNYKNLDFGIISAGEMKHEHLPHYNNPLRMNYEVLQVLQNY